eukprot:473571-Rhodomonas_salina.1
MLAAKLAIHCTFIAPARPLVDASVPLMVAGLTFTAASGVRIRAVPCAYRQRRPWCVLIIKPRVCLLQHSLSTFIVNSECQLSVNVVDTQSRCTGVEHAGTDSARVCTTGYCLRASYAQSGTGLGRYIGGLSVSLSA